MIVDAQHYVVELGKQLRAERKRQSLTLAQLGSRLPDKPAIGTLGSYELATRNVRLIDFVQICAALLVAPHELLATVDDRAFREPTVYVVDLWELAHSSRPELAAARRWAVARLGAGPVTVTRIPREALPALATLAECTIADLIAALPVLTSRAPRGPA